MAGVPEGVVLCIQCDTAHLNGVLALLFGIDPKLPVDLLFPSSEDTVANCDGWLAQHQNRLREAHYQVSRSWKQQLESRDPTAD